MNTTTTNTTNTAANTAVANEMIFQERMETAVRYVREFVYKNNGAKAVKRRLFRAQLQILLGVSKLTSEHKEQLVLVCLENDMTFTPVEEFFVFAPVSDMLNASFFTPTIMRSVREKLDAEFPSLKTPSLKADA